MQLGSWGDCALPDLRWRRARPMWVLGACAALLATHYTTGDKEQQQKAPRQSTAKEVKAGKFKKWTSKEAQQCSKPKGNSSTKYQEHHTSITVNKILVLAGREPRGVWNSVVLRRYHLHMTYIHTNIYAHLIAYICKGADALLRYVCSSKTPFACQQEFMQGFHVKCTPYFHTSAQQRAWTPDCRHMCTCMCSCEILWQVHKL